MSSFLNCWVPPWRRSDPWTWAATDSCHSYNQKRKACPLDPVTCHTPALRFFPHDFSKTTIFARRWTRVNDLLLVFNIILPPIQKRFNKEHANSSKMDTWKGHPEKQSVYDMLLLWRRWGQEKVFLPGSREESNSKRSWEKEIVFQLDVLSLWRHSHPLFCLPALDETSQRH